MGHHVLTELLPALIVGQLFFFIFFSCNSFASLIYPYFLGFRYYGQSL